MKQCLTCGRHWDTRWTGPLHESGEHGRDPACPGPVVTVDALLSNEERAQVRRTRDRLKPRRALKPGETALYVDGEEVSAGGVLSVQMDQAPSAEVSVLGDRVPSFIQTGPTTIIIELMGLAPLALRPSGARVGVEFELVGPLASFRFSGHVTQTEDTIDPQVPGPTCRVRITPIGEVTPI